MAASSRSPGAPPPVGASVSRAGAPAGKRSNGSGICSDERRTMSNGVLEVETESLEQG